MKIYLVEDDVNQAMSTRLALEKLDGDSDVRHADNAEDALQALLGTDSEPPDWRPDLICLDIIMPGTNGIEMLKELKINPRTKDIPVVMFSATSEPTAERQCRDLGADGFIHKPTDWRKYHEALEAMLTQWAC